jgi:hypothetical protein
MWYLYKMEFYSATKRMEFCHLQVNGWNRRSSKVMLVRLGRPKVTCSPSYVDCRLKKAAILWDAAHIKGMSFTRGMGQGKETTNFNVMCCLNRNEYRNLKLAGATTGRGPGRSEEV